MFLFIFKFIQPASQQAQPSLAQPSPALASSAQPIPAKPMQLSPAQSRPALPSLAQPSPAQSRTAQTSPAQPSLAQPSPAQHSRQIRIFFFNFLHFLDQMIYPENNIGLSAKDIVVSLPAGNSNILFLNKFMFFIIM